MPDWVPPEVAFRRLAEGFGKLAASATRFAESVRMLLDPAVTWDRRKARRLARRYGGRFVVQWRRGRRVYVLTGAAATRAIEAARGRGAW